MLTMPECGVFATRPAAAYPRAETQPTLADAINRYLHSGGEGRFTAQLASLFADVPLPTIDQPWAEAAERQLYPTAAAATRNRQFWTPLIAVLNEAAKQHLCSRIELRRPRAEAATPFRFFHPAEVQRIIDHSAPHLARQLRFVLSTGAHPSELFNLRWSDVDTRTGEVRLPSYDEKVSVILPTGLLVDLVRHGNQTQLVFGHQDGRRYAVKENSGGQSKTSLRTAARRARVERFGLTHVRQTWAVWYLALHGYDALLYAARWSSERSAARYRAIPLETLATIRQALLSEKMEVCALFRATQWPNAREEAA